MLELTSTFGWLFAGLHIALLVFITGRLAIYGWRRHAYLFQFINLDRTTQNWVRILLPVARQLRFQNYRTKVMTLLNRAGNRRSWDSDDFIAFQLLWCLGGGLLALLVGVGLLDLPFITVVIAGLLAGLLPFNRLQNEAHKRYYSCNRDLPYVIDYLNLAMGAGLDFGGALARVVEDAPPSPLVDEFRLVLRDMRLGKSRRDALLDLEARMLSPSMKLFVQTVVQAMIVGTDLCHTLGIMSQTMQQRRFQRAEELAGKISVKMMLPLMIFVLPAVAIVLLGPILLSTSLF